MSGWRECKLGEIITLQRGFDITQQNQETGHYPPDMQLLATETVLKQAEMIANELAGM